MPQDLLGFRALIASPSDCAAERVVAREVVADWNATYSVTEKVVIEPVFWETHARPGVGDRAQALINDQIVDGCDLGVAFFWTRLGQPTGAADSGTVEEIDRLRAQSKPVLIYFSAQPLAPDSVDRDEYERLTAYRKRMEGESLYWRYNDLADFRQLLGKHLALEVSNLIGKHRKAAPADPETLVAPPAQGNRAADAYLSRMRRLSAMWRTERDSGPINIDDGKLIVSKMADDAAHLRGTIANAGDPLAVKLDELARRAKQLMRHQLRLDGGLSYSEFWEKGTAIVDEFAAITLQ